MAKKIKKELKKMSIKELQEQLEHNQEIETVDSLQTSLIKKEILKRWGLK